MTVLARWLHRSLWEAIVSALARTAERLPALGHLVLRVAPFLAAIVLALAALRWWLHARARRRPGLTCDIMPSGDSTWDAAAWVAFFRTLFGMSSPWWKRLVIGQPWITLEFWCVDGRVTTRCWFPQGLAALVRTSLATTLPGAEIRSGADEITLAEPAARSRLRLWREALYPLGQPRVDALRGILGALSSVPSGVVQIVLSPDAHWEGRALKERDGLAGAPTSHSLVSGVVSELVDILFGWMLPRPASTGDQSPPPSVRPLPPVEKAMEPGFRVEARIRVSGRSATSAKQAMHAVIAAFRPLDGANGLRPTRVWLGQRFDRRLVRRTPPRTKGLVLVAEELANLFHLPCPGIPMEAAPRRMFPNSIPWPAENGEKVICLLEDDRQTPATISQPDCRHHIHVLGPTGSGKSTLLLNLALDDIRAGRGVGVVDPKGDLVRALLERIPRQDASRVVLIDPSYRDQPVGINVLECADPDLHEVVCDSVVTIFKKTYERFWGPRTDDVLRAVLLTLLRHPGTTLCEVPLLLIRPQARQTLTRGLHDPIGLGPFWEQYERMPDGQRLQLVGPLLNKLRAVLLRRTIRNVLGQSESTVSIPDAIDQHGILLVSLAKGLLGEETSRLLGSILVARIWQAALTRANRPEAWRPDFNLYLDEFQNYLYLPQSLDEVLVEARGYHLSLVLANQHLGQLQSSTREALASNARTRIVFQCGQEDARYLAREFDPLSERDLRNLQRFQVAARRCLDGHTERPFTGVTRPMPDGFGERSASWMVEAVLARVGRPRTVVEAEITDRLRARGLVEDEEDPAG